MAVGRGISGNASLLFGDISHRALSSVCGVCLLALAVTGGNEHDLMSIFSSADAPVMFDDGMSYVYHVVARQTAWRAGSSYLAWRRDAGLYIPVSRNK